MLIATPLQFKMTDHEADEALSPGTKDEEQRHHLADSVSKTTYERFMANRKVVLAVAAVIAIVGLILFIVGLVLIVKSKSEGRQHPGTSEQDNGKDKLVDKCSFSSEAKRAGQYFKVVVCITSTHSCLCGSTLFTMNGEFNETYARAETEQWGFGTGTTK